jgi:hypothetical protein
MNHSDHSRRIARGCALALLLAAGGARADTSGLDWLGVVYLWGADIGADYGDRSIDASFSDIVDKLEMGFMGHVEAQGDDFGGFVDVVAMSVGDSRSIGPASLRGDLDMTLMDLAMVWNPESGRFAGPEVYGGLRYISVDASLRASLLPPPDPTFNAGIDKSYTDFLLGGRYAAPINDRWRLIFSADLSAGDTEGTWSVAGYGVYRNGPHRLYAGYRHLEAEIEARNSERVDISFSGPAVGYGFAF